MWSKIILQEWNTIAKNRFENRKTGMSALDTRTANFDQRDWTHEISTLQLFSRCVCFSSTSVLPTHSNSFFFLGDVRIRRDYRRLTIVHSSSFFFLHTSSFLLSFFTREPRWVESVVIEGCWRDRRSPLLDPWRFFRVNVPSSFGTPPSRWSSCHGPPRGKVTTLARKQPCPDLSIPRRR